MAEPIRSPSLSDNQSKTASHITPGQESSADDGVAVTKSHDSHVGLGDTAGLSKDVPGYELLDELGRGGMGIVYKARHIKLNRLVALKMILTGAHASPNHLERFRLEALAVASLQHVNVVQIHEVGEHEGKPYLSLEFVDGISLQHKLAGTPLPARDAAELVETLARAMQAAHELGIIHRDLKPANVLLTKDGIPKITDFGLAKQLGRDSGQTQSGQIMGTPSYMAPEQAAGNVQALGPPADIYALGAILYEMLTGRPPFKAASVLETLELVRTQEPAPPSQLQPKTPRDLETICLKCLQKDPTKRYLSAASLANDLQRFVKGEPIHARPVGQVERLGRWCLRNRVATLLIGSLVVGIAGTTVLTIWALSERDRGAAEAEAARANQYVAYMNRVESDWENGNLQRVLNVLEFYRKPPADRKDLRGWEWHYQERLCHQELGILGGHISRVLCVAFSPEGTRLASGDANGIVKLWDAASGKELLSFTAHSFKGEPRPVHAVAFSPDGTRLATGGGPGMAALWNAVTGKNVHAFTGHNGPVVGVAFSPDGKRMASACDNNLVLLWDTGSGKQLRSYEGNLTVAFSPDAQRLAMARSFLPGDGRVHWTVSLREVDGALHWSELEHTSAVRCVAFNPDGTRLASAVHDGIVKLWDVATRQEVRAFRGHLSAARSVAFSSDGARLASASDDRTVRLWDANTGRELRTFKGHVNRVNAVAFSPDGTRLASASDDRTVRLWHAGAGVEPRTIFPMRSHMAGDESPSFRVALSPDGKRLATSDRLLGLMLWDAVSGARLPALKGPRGYGVAFSPDGTRLVAACVDSVQVWDATAGQQVWSAKANAIDGAAFSPDGTRVASAGGGAKSVQVWDAATGEALHELKMQANAVVCVAFSPDGSRLAAGGDKTVQLWDVASGLELLTLNGHENTVRGLAFSPDGTRLASASQDNTVKVWDAFNGQVLHTLRGYAGVVCGVAFSPDGKRLASANSDSTLKLWDVATGQDLRTLKGHTETVWSVDFSRDRARLVSASDDGSVKLWDAGPLTSENKAEVEALELLDLLFAKPLPRTAVRALVQKQVILTEAARQRALELVESFPDEADPLKLDAPMRNQLASRYYGAAWSVLKHPYSNAFALHIALAEMKTACDLDSMHQGYRIYLGIAHYRLGKFYKEHYQQALALLAKGTPDDSTAMAFLAMTQHRLGQNAEAQATYDRMRKTFMKENWEQGHLAEAAVLLGERAIAPKK